jgi:hypothetical protein
VVIVLQNAIALRNFIAQFFLAIFDPLVIFERLIYVIQSLRGYHDFGRIDLPVRRPDVCFGGIHPALSGRYQKKMRMPATSEDEPPQR